MTIALLVFAVCMMVAGAIVAPLGLAGGFLLGAVNALVIGMTLSLVEQVVVGARTLRWSDIPRSAGQYFWDVVSVGFTIGIPLMLLQMALHANPYRSLITTATFFLVFLLLNPVPEILYQRRHGSVIDVIRESYTFILDNWIEWFLPLGLVLAPFGVSFFLTVSSQSGRMVGLDFWHMLSLPFYLLTGWLQLLGIPSSASSLVVLVLTPIFAVLILLFRGHLFAALHRSSRRQRLFQARTWSR